ncbi:MAG TPA: hypothetical protein P5318_05625 [Candidatus Hydrogenedentes bacterium]|nr:hypothetical protein [Candidatus Hydrogenedentota bacterium]HRT19588.1 hypothetical protein [Candidatus Hydrogenedentota bacterium]HRT64156.1 hypothetical protein [Candidatus Hydrogenedentota bacterium]
MRRWLFIFSDGRILAGVLVLAACIGSAFMFEVPDLSATNVAPDFFSTSVMIACGRGFITPVVSTIPALSDFLLQKTNTFDPKQLPDTFPTFRNSRFTDNHFYLLTAAGWIWKVFGMDWRVLKLLFVVLYCASAGVVYGLFRLGMNRLFSALGALFFMTAPLVLTTLPNLRDFAKAPFLLGVILMLGHLVARPLTPRRLFGLAAGIGLTIGFGQGFRQDLFICLIPSVLIIAFFARGMGPLSVGRRLAALALFILSYAFAVWPCRATSTDEGTLMFHNVIMGLSSECSDLLGVGKASYDMEYLCNDNFAHAARCSYARRIKGNKDPIGYQTVEGARVAKEYVIDVAKTFPADFIARGLAALRFILGGTSVERAPYGPPHSQFLDRMNSLHAPVAAVMNAAGILAAVVVLLAASRREPRVAIAMLFLLLYFGSYTALLFQLRHCFHLVFVPIWFSGVLIENGVRAAAAFRLDMFRGTGWWRTVETRRMAVFALASFAVMAAPLYAARVYQYVKVGRLLAPYQTAKLESVETETSLLKNWHVFKPTSWEPFPSPNTIAGAPEPNTRWLAPLPRSGSGFDAYEMDPRVSYGVVELASNTTPCPVAVRFETEQGGNDFSRILCAQSGGTGPNARTLFFFPIYEFPASVTLGRSRFAGVALPADRAAEFKGLYRVADLEPFPFLPVLSIPENTSHIQRYQTIWPGKRQRRQQCPEMPQWLLDSLRE